jgi:hypothetical protein
MDAKPPLPQEVWERTPVEAQAYIRALDARVAVLEATVQSLQATIQHLTEELQQDSRTSSRPPGNGHAANPVGVDLADNPATRGRRGRWCRATKWMSSSLSSRRSVPTASTPCWGRIPSPSGIK